MLARTLRNLGALDREDGNYLQALADLDEAVEISRTIRYRDGEAAALAELARVEHARGNYGTAHQRAESALAAFESVRLAVASPALRASFFASVRDIQELDIEILMRLHVEHPEEGFGAAALFASERGRARSLLELLHESSAEIRRGVDTALLERERELERSIARKAEQQSRSGKQTEAEAIAAAKELDALATELEQVQSRIRETSPQYAALTHPVPLKLSEIQTKVLDDDTVLLEYALGSEKSFLWAVSTTSMEVFELRPRGEIESAVRRLYDPLMARNQKPAGETPAARARRIRQADQAYLSAAATATRMLLDPVASRIEGKRLLIVGEGVLQYLPFAALPEPGTGEQGKAPPLIANHEIITAPSASVMAVLRQETVGRKQAEKALLVLADPVFSADDARVLQAGNDRGNRVYHRIGPRGRKPADDLGAQEFLRLRFSRHEAEEIAGLTPPALTRVALDFDASRDTVLSTDLGQYRIVHLATHSLLNNQRPELSGVVLSLVDRSGRPQNGFLRLYDIYNLRLGADLVVLSACQTARGGEIEGEGLIGLTRGFLYAGAPRVVATLWEVDDRTTALVMKHFYEGDVGSWAEASRGTEKRAGRGGENQRMGATILLGRIYAPRRMAVDPAMRLARRGPSRSRPSTACWRCLDPIATSRPIAISRFVATLSASSNGEAARHLRNTLTRPSTAARGRLATERSSATPPRIALASRECSCSRWAGIAPGRPGLWTKRQSRASCHRSRKPIAIAAWNASVCVWANSRPTIAQLILSYYQGDKGDKIKNRNGLTRRLGISARHAADAGAAGSRKPPALRRELCAEPGSTASVTDRQTSAVQDDGGQIAYAIAAQ